MQPIPQSLLLRFASNKFLDGLQLVCTACLKSARVVENVSSVVRKCEFIVDVVKATLSTGSSWSAVAERICASKSNLYCGFEHNLDGRWWDWKYHLERAHTWPPPDGPDLWITGLSVVSQTLCNIEVLPAFALPMISTLNWTSGVRGFGSGAGEGGDGDGTGDGAEGGPRQQISCFAPIARKCCERKDGAMCWSHVVIRRLLLYTQYKTSADWYASWRMPFPFTDWSELKAHLYHCMQIRLFNWRKVKENFNEKLNISKSFLAWKSLKKKFK